MGGHFSERSGGTLFGQWGGTFKIVLQNIEKKREKVSLVFFFSLLNDFGALKSDKCCPELLFFLIKVKIMVLKLNIKEKIWVGAVGGHFLNQKWGGSGEALKKAKWGGTLHFSASSCGAL